ncbi:MAG: hypothetical protein KDD46_02925, partial [Bdellovibrionales bacterium]|nr:hypothetical protein [Bdellovibrionales bacterium]
MTFLFAMGCGWEGNYLGKSGGDAGDGHRPSKSPFYVDTPSLNLVYPDVFLANINNPKFRIGNVLEGNHARYFTDASCSEDQLVFSNEAGSSNRVDYALSLQALVDDGTYTFYANVLDDINGYSECVGPVSYVYDGTPPKFVDNSPGDASSIALTTSESVNDILIYDDAACSNQVGELLASEDGNDYVYAPSLPINGIYAFYAQTTDIAMNLSDCFGPLIYIYTVALPYFDIDPPTPTIINTGDVDYNITYYNHTSVDLQVADVTVNTTGTVTYNVSVLNGTTGTPTITVSVTGGDGTIDGIEIAPGTATDGIGDAEGGTENTSVTVDNTAPTVSLGAPSTTNINTGNVDYAVTYTGASSINLTTGNITVNTTGLIAGVHYTVSVLNGTTATPTIRIAVTSGDGTIDSVEIAAGTSQDAAGNIDAGDTDATTVNVDNTDPVLSVGGPSTTSIGTGPVNYAVTITGADNFTLNGGDITVNTSGSVTYNVSVTNGNTSTPTVTVNVTGGDGTIDGIVIAGGSASDLAGNTDSGDSDNTTVTVQNNLPEVNFSSASQASVNETGTLTATVTIAAPYFFDVTVPFSVNGSSTATDPDDYTISASPIVITAGNTSADITLTLADDGVYEGNETVVIDLGAPTNATLGAVDTHTATITEDESIPAVTLSVDNATIAEASGVATFTATLSNPSTQNVTVNLAFSGTATGSGTDYTASGSSILITAGNTTGNITVTADQDLLDENDETVIVDIDSVTNGTESGVQQQTTTITDDDDAPTVTLSLDNATIAEASGVATFTATLSAVSALDVTVNLALSGTATGSGTDYTASGSSILITAGNTTGTITVTADQDLLDENDETVIVDIDSVTNGTESGVQQQTTTITDDDDAPTVTLSLDNATIAEASGVATFTATLSAVSALDVTVNLALSGTATGSGTDYTASGSSILITAGNTTGAITVTADQDLLDENDETVIVDIDSVTNGTESGVQQQTTTITDDDDAPTVTLSVDNANIAEASGVATFTATLSAVSALDVTV